LPWFSHDKEVDYVCKALSMVCERGWRLLPQYRFNNETGEWKHFDNLEYKERKWLGHISYDGGKMEFRGKKTKVCREENLLSHSDMLDAAEEVFKDANKQAAKRQVPDQRILFGEGMAEKLRWFLLPFEAKQIMCSGDAFKVVPPFTVKSYADDDDTAAPGIGSVGSYGKRYAMTKEVKSVLNFKPVPQQWTKTTKKQQAQTAADKEKSVVSDVKVSNTNGDAEKEKPGDKAAGGESCDTGACVLSGERAAPLAPAKGGWRCPPKELFKPFLEAMDEFSMVGNGDRVLVCLSGGKDSLSLLHALRQYQHYAEKALGVKFDLGAVTVDPQSSAYDPRPLIPYLASLGVEYFYEEQAIMAQALAAEASSICAFCSRLKRGRIYAAAR
jgi:hypothetical protein